MMRYMIILLLVSGLFADSYEHKSERHINKELSHLGLLKDQSRDVKQILKEFRKQLEDFEEFKENIEVKRKALFVKDVLETKELDKLNQILDEKAHEIENDFLQKMHVILTPSQREKFIRHFDDWEVE